MRRRPGLSAGSLWLGATFVTLACGQPTASAPAPAVPTATATVVRTDVASHQAVGGMIGYEGMVAIAAPSGTAPAAVVQARSAVDLATAQVAGARQAAADAQLLAARQAQAARGAVDAAQAAVGADQQRADQQALV
ncbi:MAG: hypothetical protein M3Z97_14495, partial [Candidatus Dormibacteraeota bacterium]|nr:hypothetical protein [Candidatus Dormibacteraeota bacterium]